MPRPVQPEDDFRPCGACGALVTSCVHWRRQVQAAKLPQKRTRKQRRQSAADRAAVAEFHEGFARWLKYGVQ